MPGKSKKLRLSSILSSISSSAFRIEIRKSSRGAIAVVSGVMSIGEYTESNVELVSHSGRIAFLGESLGISVLEGRVVEIYGRITEVRLGYGRS